MEGRKEEPRIVADTKDEINSLIRTRSYASKEEVISDAIKALLKQRPELKNEIPIEASFSGGDP